MRKKDIINSEIPNIKKEIDEKAQLEIAKINARAIIDIQHAERISNEKIKDIETKIAELDNMDKEAKTEKFKKAITDKTGHIQFWSFFEYMKTRTADIPNIVW